MIKDYLILSTTSKADMRDQVLAYLKSGYQLQGNIQYDNRVWIQALIKAEEVTEIKPTARRKKASD